MRVIGYEAVGNAVVGVGELEEGYETPQRAMICQCLSIPMSDGTVMRGTEVAIRLASLLNKEEFYDGG